MEALQDALLNLLIVVIGLVAALLAKKDDNTLRRKVYLPSWKSRNKILR